MKWFSSLKEEMDQLPYISNKDNSATIDERFNTFYKTSVFTNFFFAKYGNHFDKVSMTDAQYDSLVIAIKNKLSLIENQ